MRATLVRLLVVLAALLVLPGSAWGRELFRCRMSGRVQTTCCCAVAQTPRAERCRAGIRADDCCERVRSGDGIQASHAAAAALTIEAAALTAVVAEPAHVTPSRSARQFAGRQERGPPRLRHPLFVVHCAYLC